MIEILDVTDGRAVRKQEQCSRALELMINTKRSEEGTAKHVRPEYIQHNPLIPDGSVALGHSSESSPASARKRASSCTRSSAVGDYVWAHVNFFNLFSDDPADTGIAGVDIYKLDADGKAIEHWDTLQLVGEPENSAPMLGPGIPRANPNGMF